MKKDNIRKQLRPWVSLYNHTNARVMNTITNVNKELLIKIKEIEYDIKREDNSLIHIKVVRRYDIIKNDIGCLLWFDDYDNQEFSIRDKYLVSDNNCIVVHLDNDSGNVVEDGFTVLRWIEKNYLTLNIDKEKIFVGGNGVGGKFAMDLVNLGLIMHYMPIAFMMLLFPSVEDFDYEFKKFPPCMILNSDNDPYFSNIEVLKDKLYKSRVSILYKCYKGSFHNFDVIGANSEMGRKALRYERDVINYAYDNFYNEYEIDEMIDDISYQHDLVDNLNDKEVDDILNRVSDFSIEAKEDTLANVQKIIDEDSSNDLDNIDELINRL